MSKIPQTPAVIPTRPDDLLDGAHRQWCDRKTHDRELREHGPDAQGCYSRDIEVTPRVGAWLIEGKDGAEVALDGPGVCLFLPAGDVRALCGWLLAIDPLEVQPALVRLSALAERAAA